MRREMEVRKGRDAVGYQVRYEGKEYSLVRSKVRPSVMYVKDDRMNDAAIAGHRCWTDAGGELAPTK